MAKAISSEQEMTKRLRLGGQDAEQALAEIYQSNRAVILQLVLKNGGTSTEAKDVFQEAIIRLFENVQAGKFKGESTLSTYLYSIARFVWLNRLKRYKVEQKIKDTLKVNPVVSPFLDELLDAEEEQQVFALFDHLGPQCKSLLIASIYYQYSIEEIRAQLDYNSNQVVRNQKYRCLNKLRTLLKAQPHLLSFLSSKK